MIGYVIGAVGYGNAPGGSGKFTLASRRKPDEPWLIFSDSDNPDRSPQRQRIPGKRIRTTPSAAEQHGAVQPLSTGVSVNPGRKTHLP